MSVDPRVADAVAVLRAGGLVAFPTETVYGLGADAASAEAVRRIFTAKGRPDGRPLTVHLGPSAQPARWGRWSAAAEVLAARYWPGPLTLIVPKADHVPDGVTAGGPGVGLRVPAHPLAMDFLDAFGGGVAAPSANRTGSVSPTTAQHVHDELGDAVDRILDGGPCPVGVESSVLSLLDPERPVLLRRGALSRLAIEQTLGRAVHEALADSTGHYAPRTPVRLVDEEAMADAVAAVGGDAAVLSRERPPDCVAWERAEEGPEAYGRRLYAALRALDAAGASVLLVARLPADPSWETLASRLAAAAGVAASAATR